MVHTRDINEASTA